MRKVLSRVPPPFLFLGALLLGALLQRLHPLPLVPPERAQGATVAGIVLVLGGVGLFIRCITLFRRNRTTLNPSGKPSSLLTGGPYRRSRNPIYVGLTAVGLGVAALTDSLWMVVVLALPLAVLQTAIIPREEQNLLEQFGDEYREYQRRVRRWI